ncbi:MAG: OsmC family protein [Pelomonas sp.]|nr:OsmC family protein [Roseateles sp.]
MADDNNQVSIHLAQRADYAFDADFGAGVPPLVCDEPPPTGQGAGPSPVQLLAAAVGNCLLDSLLFALRKYKQRPEPLSGAVVATVGRNEAGRVRVLGLQATLKLGVAAADLEHLDRVLAQFEDFCTVTQSVRAAIPVEVVVLDAAGAKLK